MGLITNVKVLHEERVIDKKLYSKSNRISYRVKYPYIYIFPITTDGSFLTKSDSWLLLAGSAGCRAGECKVELFRSKIKIKPMLPAISEIL